MGVVQVNNLVDLQSLFSQADETRLFVLDFYADWCGPCRFIAPVFEQLSQEYGNASFLKINVDFARDISQQYAVRAMPTFVLIKRSKEVQRVQGADPNSLKSAISQHYSESVANQNAATPSERAFLQQFVSQSSKVTRYSDEISTTLALSVIPDRIKEESTLNGTLNRELLAKGLLDWFKNDFFSWCDTPNCPDCGTPTSRETSSTGTPNHEEASFDASRVEVYICACGKQIRFPRYNDPAKLLETRTGRCGEWANCFCLVATSLDFDVRFVYDVTDHVWCELWIPEVSKWIHCDPCEGKYDAPLMYEKGWGKKLSYVIAYGKDHVADVTWRYSLDFRATLKRRQNVREVVLFNFLTKLGKRMSSDASPTRINELQNRRLCELVEFLRTGPAKDVDNYDGRNSGDIAWRTARLELGKTKETAKTIIRPNSAEIANKKLLLSYNCAMDSYSRGTESVPGWSTYVNESTNVMRKKENDWKKAYLCCKEGSSEGEISWVFDLTGLQVDKATLKILGAECFHDGSLTITCCSNDVCMRVPASGELVIDDVSPGLLKITASFQVGRSENSFQHAQLFRTSLDDTKPQMSIEIQLE